MRKKNIENVLVCRKWKVACQLSWSNVRNIDPDLMMVPLDKRGQVYEKILERCNKYLTHLTFNTYEENRGIKILNLMKENYRNIIHFDIHLTMSVQKISSKDLIQMIASMPTLKYFRVFRDKYHVCNFTNLCTQILEQLPDTIEEIHLISHSSLPLQFAPVSNFLLLKIDNNNYYYSLNEEELYLKHDLFIRHILNDKFYHLRCLTLHYWNLTYAVIESLTTKNTLVNLDIAWSDFADGNVSSMFLNLHNLKKIKLHEAKFNYEL